MNLRLFLRDWAIETPGSLGLVLFGAGIGTHQPALWIGGWVLGLVGSTARRIYFDRERGVRG